MFSRFPVSVKKDNCCLFHSPISLQLLLLCVGYTIWRLYAACSHALLVQLVMCHQSAQIYLDVGHYPESRMSVAAKLLLAQNWFEWDVLLSFDTKPISVSAFILLWSCSSLVFWYITHAHKHKYTPVFAKGVWGPHRLHIGQGSLRYFTSLPLCF